MKYLIGYTRVSTKEQGQSKNGLEAQREAILQFANVNGYHLLDIVEEVASGKLGTEDRPVLKAAMAKAAKVKAEIVVSKLDRLSRDASFVLNLMKTTAKFIVVELGEDVSPFMLHIYAVVAEQERALISSRTTAALAALKAKGKVLGGSVVSIHKANKISVRVQKDKADDFAKKLQPTVERMRNTGMSLQAIADELNNNNTRTARGGEWAPTTVKNLIARF